eukprot:1977350-Ditylum_brightwellii.AAC.1
MVMLRRNFLPGCQLQGGAESRTGIIIFVKNAPIIWFSNRQNTVESATFGRCGQEHQHTAVNPAEEAQ